MVLDRLAKTLKNMVDFMARVVNLMQSKLWYVDTGQKPEWDNPIFVNREELMTILDQRKVVQK